MSGAKKYRRTSDFSAPHKPVYDGAGHQVRSINDASRSYYVPLWIRESPHADVREWALRKYAHVPPAAEGKEPSTRHKFPKERKPSLADLMHDISILLEASLMLDEPIFAWVEDAAHYFNQFGYSPEELWKSNLVVNARPGDLARDGTAFRAGQLVFVSERRLGFGSYASSNIAQRFSNALTGWVLDSFDRREEAARLASRNDKWDRWHTTRLALETQCRKERPKRPGEALSECTQTRLATFKMFTDDPAAIVVGVTRTLRLLDAWREVTQGINIAMASEEKRQLGAGVEWIGIFLLAAIGIAAVPRNKLLRAKDAVQRTLDGTITYGEYRALVGLLEHLRFLTQLQAEVTNVLYRPHRLEAQRGDGPSACVVCTRRLRRSRPTFARLSSAGGAGRGIIPNCAGPARGELAV